MFNALKQNRFLKFLITSSFIYFCLYLIYELVIKKYTFWDQAFIRIIINSADAILHILGHDTFKRLSDTDYQVIGIDGSNGVWVGASCNALTLFFLFSVFIFSYPGHQKSKWWFIPIGILSIHILNIFRVVALALIAFYKPEYLDFNHTYTFTFIIYCYIFLLWIIWVNKYSSKESHGEK
jgi:exosortase family protein XrtF